MQKANRGSILQDGGSTLSPRRSNPGEPGLQGVQRRQGRGSWGYYTFSFVHPRKDEKSPSFLKIAYCIFENIGYNDFGIYQKP
jgi:hypothetical protein